MGVHVLCSHPVLPKQAVTWGPSHGLSLRTVVMPSQPLLSPQAVPAGRDRPEQSWAYRCQGSAHTSPLLVCVSDVPNLLDLVSPWVTIHPCLGQFLEPGRLMKLTQMCSCPGIWSISVRNLLPWSTNLCWVSSPSLQPLLWSCQGSLSCSLCTASATCRT